MSAPVATHGSLQRVLPDAQATEQLGRALAGAVTAVGKAGGLIELHGDLGAGKTTFSRGLLNGLGHAGRVKSPTYTLMESYALAQPVLHMDLYRLADPSELEQLGLEDFPTSEWLWLLEWPQRAQGQLPPADLQLVLGYAGSGRQAQLRALSSTAALWIEKLASSFK